MRGLKISSLSLALLMVTPLTSALSVGADISAAYNIPVTCALANLPTSVNLSVLATETGLYTTNFLINCNTSSSIGLSLTSANQAAGAARLLSATGNYLNYTVSINNIVYTMGQSNQVAPNLSNALRLDIAKPTYAGQYQDTLVFTISY
jgi:spore coat protein U-like protein